MPRGATPRSPLPQQHGVDAMRVRMPQDGPWSTVRDHLVERLAPLGADGVDALIASGGVVAADGAPVHPSAPFVPRSLLWVRRELPDEAPVPGTLQVRYEDERVVVVDKPHFLATAPRGRHVVQTATTRLREALVLPELSPAHRLDRLTAGLLLLVKEQRWRGAYQGLFAQRAVEKDYLAVAGALPGLDSPTRISLRLSKPRGALASTVVDGEPNAVTIVHRLSGDGGDVGDAGDVHFGPPVEFTGSTPAEFTGSTPAEVAGSTLSDVGGRVGMPGCSLYRLVPVTGRTHQLRVTMAHIGAPIIGDPLYPSVLPDDAPGVAPGDFSTPLRLLAHRLAYTDPVDGRRVEVVSARSLTDPASEGPR